MIVLANWLRENFGLERSDCMVYFVRSVASFEFAGLQTSGRERELDLLAKTIKRQR